MRIYLMDADLRLFDGAAPGGDGAAAEGAAQAETQSAPESGRRGKTGDKVKVVYGKQPEAAYQKGNPGGPNGPAGRAGARERSETWPAGRGEQSGLCDSDSSDAGSTADESAEKAALTPEERKAQFESLISGEYKDLFAERTQGIIDRRFKEAKGLEGQVAATQPILEMLAQKYGLDATDTQKLAQAMETDDAYWEQAAQEHGMSVPQYREFQKLQRENEAFRRAKVQAQGREEAQRQVDAWQREAQELKADYPDFDLGAEVGNPQFLGMLKSGIPVKHAYEVLHLGDIKTGVARQTAQQAEKRVTESIRAKGSRPAENGTSSSAGVIFKSDPSALTRAERAEIAKRAARGEHIEF